MLILLVISLTVLNRVSITGIPSFLVAIATIMFIEMALVVSWQSLNVHISNSQSGSGHWLLSRQVVIELLIWPTMLACGFLQALFALQDTGWGERVIASL
ncbi:hypothetical protein [Photobacterium sp. R1]